ncbi:MAG: hypothetical protein IEMM0002_1243 [bacterium]|nr:MAG: hypothetical protein IEMM0002_1243 [bacterium]
MKIFSRLITGFFIGAVFVLVAAPRAEPLTILQENLIGVNTKLTVVVSDFKPDGLLTNESVQSMVEKQLISSGFEIVSASTPPPLVMVNVNIVKSVDGAGGATDYFVDINVYNLTTIQTEYKLRKGTVWNIGAYKITPGKNFPLGVEETIRRMVRYFVGDFFTANPNLPTADIGQQ